MSAGAYGTEWNAPLIEYPGAVTDDAGHRGFALNDMAHDVREVNTANGWHQDERSVGDDIALLHSEVSEAFEAYRDHGFSDATGLKLKPEGWGSELADVLIRLLDTADRTGVDLLAEFDRKLAYNRTRGHKHGGKRL